MVVFALVASAVLFGMEERVLALANRRADQLKHLIRGGSPQTFDVLNRKWIVGRNGEVYHYQFYNPRRRELNGVCGVRVRSGDACADPSRYMPRGPCIEPGQAANGASWQMSQGWVRRFDVKNRRPRRSNPSSRSRYPSSRRLFRH